MTRPKPHKVSVALVGGRGFVARELRALVDRHPRMELAFSTSRQARGEFLPSDPQAVAEGPADAYVLGLPDGSSAPFVARLRARRPQALILDLSADHRFDRLWHYGLPELRAPDEREAGAVGKVIANPGCYATAMQIALAPMNAHIQGIPVCFGVSGYSGAGSRPSPRNDPEALHDNLLGYQATGHLHEREVSYHLGRQIAFVPHVAGFFRGLQVTLHMVLSRRWTLHEVLASYHRAYAREALVEVVDQVPQIREMVGRPGVRVGGFSLSENGRRMVAFVCLDNLLKGAATQALQNLNLAFGGDAAEGILT